MSENKASIILILPTIILTSGVLPVPTEPRENHASTSNGQKLMVQTTASSSMPLLPNCPSTASSHFAFSPQKRKGPNSVSSTGSSSSRTAAHTVSDDSESDTERRPPPQKVQNSLLLINPQQFTFFCLEQLDN